MYSVQYFMNSLLIQLELGPEESITLTDLENSTVVLQTTPYPTYLTVQD